MRGKVARLVVDKGFGFIKGQDGVERFFHRSVVKPMPEEFELLREGQDVDFEHEDGPKGPRASSVSLK